MRGQKNKVGRKPKDGFLTVKQQRFVKAWLDGMTIGDAYMLINPGVKKDIARNKGWQFKEHLKKSIGYAKLMEYGGLGEDLLIKKHLELLNSNRTIIATEGGKITDTLEVPDNTVQMSALKHANELLGHVVSKSEVDVAMRMGKQHWTDMLKDSESESPNLFEEEDEPE